MQRRLCLLALAILAALAAPAHGQNGPSLDCAKPEGPIDRTICRNPRLVALDRQLDEAFAAVRAGLDAAAQQALDKEQEEWLDMLGYCESRAACIEARYVSRLPELERRIGTPKPSTADYPLVFPTSRALAGLGVTVVGSFDPEDPPPVLAYECYYYGDGSTNVSFSEEFLARYRARGFSRRSLCMGLLSEARYNPETGERLPTVLVANAEALRAASGDADADVGRMMMINELPLVVPDCFRRALPLTDCRMRYDLKTGVKLPAVAEARYQEIGRRIERMLASPKIRKAFHYIEKSASPRGTIMLGYAQERGDVNEITWFGFYDYAAEFPKGYGYAINAHGAAGEDPANAPIKVAMDSRYQATDARIAAFRRALDEPAKPAPGAQ